MKTQGSGFTNENMLIQESSVRTGSPGKLSPIGSPRLNHILHETGSADSPEIVIQTNNAFTKYLGGKFITWYSLSVVLSSLAVLALSIYLLVSYRAGSNADLREYLGSSSLKIHMNPVSYFFNTSVTVLKALNTGASPSTAFCIQPAIISITVVSNLSSGNYLVYTNNSGSVLTSSNAADCNTSVTYNCDYRYSNVSATGWYDSAIKTTEDFVFLGPNVLVMDNIVTNSIDLAWKSTQASSVTAVNMMTLNLSYLSFPYDSFLDKNGGQQRVWLINKTTTAILTAFGVETSEYINGTDTTDLGELASSMTDAEWITALKESYSNVSITSTQAGLPGRVTALVSPVEKSPFVLIVGSTSSQFTSYSVTVIMIVLIVVSAIPLIATSISTTAYLLRVLAIKRRESKKQKELYDAHMALKAIRDNKLKSMSGTSLLSTNKLI